MRCKACNIILSDYELSRKDSETGEFIDLCNRCLTSAREGEYNYSIDASDLDVTETKGDSLWLQE